MCILGLAYERAIFQLLDLKIKNLSSLIIDISNVSVMILLNLSQKILLLEPKIMSST
jgi:hypothetical protein